MAHACHLTLTHPISLDLSDAEQFAAIRGHLRRAGYTEERIGELLGSRRSLHLRHRGTPLPLYLHRTRHASPLETLVRLFHLGCPVPVDAAEMALAPLRLKDYVNAGLVEVDGPDVRAVVELVPFEGLVLAADWSSEAGAGGSHVMGVAASTRTLAGLALWPTGRRLLDLGTGCGVLALLGRGRGNEVTAVDCNARAIQLARYNMCLNGLSAVDWRVADFFAPLGGQTFDLVLCNPPFVISPRSELLHSDSGRPVDQLCESLIRTAPQWLSAGGYLQMVLNFAQLRNQDWRDRLTGWCRGTGCDALLLYSHIQDAAEYALDRLQETVEDPATQRVEFARWLAYYEQQGIEAIGFGLMTLRRAENQEPWFYPYQFRPGENPDGGVVRRAFARRDFFRTHPTDALLLQARMRRAEGLFRQQKHTFSNHGWTLIESRLGVIGGPCPAPVPAEVGELIAWCDGTRPVGAYLTKTRAGKQASGTAAFAATIRQLVELGLLDPVP